MGTRSITLAAAVLFVVAPAIASAPTISGKYVSVSRTFCQPTITLQYAQDQNGDTFVSNASLSSPDTSEQAVGLVSFDSSTQMVSINGWKDSGDSVLLATNGGTQGKVISETTNTGSFSYSNTAATVTLDGTTYNATYGKLGKTNVPEYFALVGLNSSGCSKQFEFTLK